MTCAIAAWRIAMRPIVVPGCAGRLWPPPGVGKTCGLLGAAPRLSSRWQRTVAWRQLNFEFDQLVPQGIGAFAIWNGEQFAQAAARIGQRGGSRSARLHLNRDDCFLLLLNGRDRRGFHWRFRYRLGLDCRLLDRRLGLRLRLRLRLWACDSGSNHCAGNHHFRSHGRNRPWRYGGNHVRSFGRNRGRNFDHHISRIHLRLFLFCLLFFGHNETIA